MNYAPVYIQYIIYNILILAVMMYGNVLYGNCTLKLIYPVSKPKVDTIQLNKG